MSVFEVLKRITHHPLTINHKFHAINRFLSWQIKSRFGNKTHVVDWIEKSRLLVRNGDHGLTGNIYTGLIEFPEMGYLLHALGSNETFIDVGANAGAFTILASAVVGAASHSIEPIPESFARLTDNVNLNKVSDKVVCHNLGIGDKKGILSFVADSDTTNHVVTDNDSSHATVSVEVDTLDKLLNDVDPGLIKIDVEGFETSVLKGADKTLKKKSLHSLIIELNGSGNRYGYNEAEIPKILLSYGFRPFSYNPMTRTLVSIDGINTESDNTIFIKDPETQKIKILDKRKINIFGTEI